MEIWQIIRKSALAGLLISLAGAVYLRCDDKIIGAILFSVGLLAVLLLGANLFTGKVGYIKDLKSAGWCGVILVVNLVVAALAGWVYSLTYGQAAAMVSRLNKSILQLLLDSAGCGALIYIACEGWAKTHNPLLPIGCVAAFILAGFEHCVADAFYLGASGVSWQGVGLVLLVAAGNSIGSLVVRWLQVSLFGREGRPAQ